MRDVYRVYDGSTLTWIDLDDVETEIIKYLEHVRYSLFVYAKTEGYLLLRDAYAKFNFFATKQSLTYGWLGSMVKKPEDLFSIKKKNTYFFELIFHVHPICDDLRNE